MQLHASEVKKIAWIGETLLSSVSLRNHPTSSAFCDRVLFLVGIWGEADGRNGGIFLIYDWRLYWEPRKMERRKINFLVSRTPKRDVICDFSKIWGGSVYEASINKLRKWSIELMFYCWGNVNGKSKHGILLMQAVWKVCQINWHDNAPFRLRSPEPS